MKALLQVLLPKIAPGMRFVLVAHEGKRDLDKSIPRKLKAWQTPNARFIVVRDQDRANCQVVKSTLTALVPKERRHCTLVRLACRELESWIIGDLDALATAFGKPTLAALTDKAKYRDPDALAFPADEIRRLIPAYQKVSGARRVAEHLEPARNTSHSFVVFLSAVRRFAAESAGVPR